MPGKFDIFNTFVIDTPGVGDPNNSDAEHLIKMIKYIKDDPKVSVIILVFNSAHPRFGVNQRRLLELFYSLAPGTPIHQHLAIVWTRWRPSALKELGISTNIYERKEKFYNFIKEHLPQIPKNEVTSIPQIFIDSKEARNPTNEFYHDLQSLLAWAQSKEPIQKIGIPLPQILAKNESKIFILPSGSPNVSLISITENIDFTMSYTLIPDELPIDVKLILKREIIHEKSKSLNYFYLLLTSKDSAGNILKKKFKLNKEGFGKIFCKNENKYYPIYLYSCEIQDDLNYFFCHSLKPMIKFRPFKGEYIFLIPEFSQIINPIDLHLNFLEKDGKIYENVVQQISFSNVNISLPGTKLIGPLELEWEHNHQNKISNCFVKKANNKQFFKSFQYILLEKGKEHTEGFWNQTHIKEPDKYKLGNGEIYLTKKVINKDPMPPKPIAPFNCKIWHDGDKTNGYNKGKPYGWEYHSKGSLMEIFRLYGKGWSLKRKDYANWGDSISYKDAETNEFSREGNIQCIW